ncbi:hypothetical protein [Ponticoccus alexandrii]|uniref:Uncharacterized protein n=1 Tax=Ponticoccus alexandrii TaxID=1943633 RepID=A0ABX7F9I0_9RHOB|nr:hypothetical protein [Ponticoccus alexandrii]ETA54003.1 hypothetical protein P279_00200 [Rhodobacteraceae bacterium PD-2]QRF66353.1 hypothetical protein GQA70_08550 [Ponticoccus alexandrii]
MTSTTDVLPLIQSVLDDASLPRDQHDALSKAADIIAAQNGVAAIAAERQRQIAVEGWTPDHDDSHTGAELAMMAACLAAPQTLYAMDHLPSGLGVGFVIPTPFEAQYDKRPWTPDHLPDNETLPLKERRRQLVISGALCAAEIDRLDRAAQIRASRVTPSTTSAQDRKA